MADLALEILSFKLPHAKKIIFGHGRHQKRILLIRYQATIQKLDATVFSLLLQMSILTPKLNCAIKTQAYIGQLRLKIRQRQQLRNIVAVCICDNRTHLLILANDELKQISCYDELALLSLLAPPQKCRMHCCRYCVRLLGVVERVLFN